SEDLVVARAGGSHRLVTRYFGWGEDGSYGALSFGAVADPLQSIAFGREWGGGSRSANGGAEPVSLAETLANAGRFRRPPSDVETPLADIDYALRWHPASYRALLIDLARKIGVAHIQGQTLDIEPDGSGGISSLLIDGQARVEADLYLDCSGPAGHLVSALPGFARQDWSDALPTRRLMVAPPAAGMLALEDRVSLLPQGWLSEFAGRDGLQSILGIAAQISDEAAVAALGTNPQVVTDVMPSRIDKPWLGNAIAIGDASAQFEPLGWLNLDLAHRQIALLLEMLPGSEVEPLERAEFNRRVDLMLGGARDFLATHYAAPRARQVFASDTPQSVAVTIDQFTRRGRLPFREEAPLLPEELMGLMRCLGFPQGSPPQSSTNSPSQVQAARDAFASKAQAALNFAPQYRDWLASLVGDRA
ncbi:MAG: tryptophan 7-halogenase, partial [Pseudomonadota bacterium]